jgi:serine/threonine protein kinase
LQDADAEDVAQEILPKLARKLRDFAYDSKSSFRGFKARWLELQRFVASKMLRDWARAGEKELARFRAEADVIARLQHPNIVQIYDVGDVAGPCARVGLPDVDKPRSIRPTKVRSRRGNRQIC